MTRLPVLLLVAVVLAGCATSREIYTADGRRVYSIECRAVFYQSFDCIEKAQELCGEKGYTILEKSGEPSTSFARNMIIQCR